MIATYVVIKIKMIYYIFHKLLVEIQTSPEKLVKCKTRRKKKDHDVKKKKNNNNEMM